MDKQLLIELSNSTNAYGLQKLFQKQNEETNPKSSYTAIPDNYLLVYSSQQSIVITGKAGFNNNN